jgi:hypothetical protein
MESAIEMKDFAYKLRQRVEDFLKQVHEEFNDEFAYFITKIEPELSLIDKLAAQRLLVRSAAYELTKRIIAEQLPEELINLDEAPPMSVQK